MARVLLIEDDPRIRRIVERGLGSRGVSVSSAGDGVAGIDALRTQRVDLVLLDLRLPDLDGLMLLRAIRAARPQLPVIAVTALAHMRSKVDGLDHGADDYVTKPFSVAELAARVRARLRGSQGSDVCLQAGGLTLDLATHRASLDGRSVALSAREVTLLATFVRHPGRVLSRAELLRLVWEIAFDPGTNVVDVFVAALRRKLGAGVIETVRGRGYRLRPRALRRGAATG